MAGLLYFRGEGVERNIPKAVSLFKASAKDEISDYMLLAIKYFEIEMKGTKPLAIAHMKCTHAFT